MDTITFHIPEGTFFPRIPQNSVFCPAVFPGEVARKLKSILEQADDSQLRQMPVLCVTHTSEEREKLDAMEKANTPFVSCGVGSLRNDSRLWVYSVRFVMHCWEEIADMSKFVSLTGPSFLSAIASLDIAGSRFKLHANKIEFGALQHTPHWAIWGTFALPQQNGTQKL